MEFFWLRLPMFYELEFAILSGAIFAAAAAMILPMLIQ
jgi:hypothetical protein